MTKEISKRVKCSTCPIQYSCPVPKDDRWRDFLDNTTKEENCPLVKIIKKEKQEIK